MQREVDKEIRRQREKLIRRSEDRERS